MAPTLFTNSPEVLVTMRSLLPFMCAALVVHTASMATEGMLLAGALCRHHSHLCHCCVMSHDACQWKYTCVHTCAIIKEPNFGFGVGCCGSMQ